MLQEDSERALHLIKSRPRSPPSCHTPIFTGSTTRSRKRLQTSKNVPFPSSAVEVLRLQRPSAFRTLHSSISTSSKPSARLKVPLRILRRLGVLMTRSRSTSSPNLHRSKCIVQTWRRHVLTRFPSPILSHPIPPYVWLPTQYSSLSRSKRHEPITRHVKFLPCYFCNVVLSVVGQ